MPVLAITGAISGLKTAGELAASFLKIHDTALIQGKVIELQSIILTAQQSALASLGEQFALLEEKRELESKIAKLEKWEAEKQRYELKTEGYAALVYAVKEECKGSEPPHNICANCYESGRKSILQRYTTSVGRNSMLTCAACKTDIVVSGTMR